MESTPANRELAPSIQLDGFFILEFGKFGKEGLGLGPVASGNVVHQLHTIASN